MVIKQIVPVSDHTLGIRIGDVCCALQCRDSETYDSLKQLYRDYLTDQPVDILVMLETTDRLGQADLPSALSDMRYIHENGSSFRTSSQIISGEYNLARSAISLTGERSLADPGNENNHLNKLFALLYYSACKVKYNGAPPAMLIHACGVIRRQKALVFLGPSGAGKTTVARLCGRQHGVVINDETLLISRPGSNGRIMAQGVPFISQFSLKGNGSAPLRCVLFLKQGLTTQVRPLDKADAYLRFLRQIINPAYIGQRDRRAIYSLMADFGGEITNSIPFYELEFTLNEAALWPVIEELENSLAVENESYD